jgi:hypothetical protein
MIRLMTEMNSIKNDTRLHNCCSNSAPDWLKNSKRLHAKLFNEIFFVLIVLSQIS